MATLTYTQIYAMTAEEINAIQAENMENNNHDDNKAINEKTTAIAKVKQARKEAYPDIKEQLDMQYWDKVNDTTTWQDAIEDIKNAHPLPTD